MWLKVKYRKSMLSEPLSSQYKAAQIIEVHPNYIIDWIAHSVLWFWCSVAHWTTKHIRIIITSAQKVDNLKQTLDRLLSTIRVRVIKTTGNIGIYRPRLFHMSFGPNQLYSLGYWLRKYFAIFRGEVRGIIVEVKSSQIN